VRNQAFYTVERPETSTYVPSVVNIFVFLALMDQQILNNFSFGRACPFWHPFLSQAYISVLIYVHVLRVMKGIIPLPGHVQNFLDTFETSFPYDSLFVPGPLVPLFESITAFEGNFSWIGNVCAVFPDMDQAVLGELHLRNNFFYTWPFVPFVLDQIRRIQETGIPVTGFNDHRYFTNIFGVAAQAAPDWTHEWMYSVHSRFVPFVPETRLNSFIQWINRSKIPTRPQINAWQAGSTLLSIEHFFGFFDPLGNYIPWFESVAPVMSIYCKHFEGSVSLSRISHRGLGASGIVFRPTQNSRYLPRALRFTAAAGGIPAHYRPDEPATLAMNGSHNDPNMEEIAEQYAMLSATSVNLMGSAQPGAPPVPTNARQRLGMYWASPIMRHCPLVNVLPGFALTVRDFYLKERIH
jgi:hypothetical protein